MKDEHKPSESKSVQALGVQRTKHSHNMSFQVNTNNFDQCQSKNGGTHIVLIFMSNVF